MRPPRARRVSVESGPAVRRVLWHSGKTEVDDGEPAVENKEVLGLEVLVCDRLLLKVFEPGEQVLREAPLGGGHWCWVSADPLAERLTAHAFHDQREAPLNHLGKVD